MNKSIHISLDSIKRRGEQGDLPSVEATTLNQTQQTELDCYITEVILNKFCGENNNEKFRKD